MNKKIARSLTELLVPRGYGLARALRRAPRPGRPHSLPRRAPRHLPPHHLRRPELSSFHIFLREESGYQPHSATRDIAPGISFPASCATVFRMKRERKPSPFSSAPPRCLAAPRHPPGSSRPRRPGTQLLLPLEGRTGLMGFATLSKSEGGPPAPRTPLPPRPWPPDGPWPETAQHVHFLSEEAVKRAKVPGELDLAREFRSDSSPNPSPKVPASTPQPTTSAEEVGGATTTTSWTPPAASSAASWPTSAAKASPPRSSWPPCAHHSLEVHISTTAKTVPPQ